MNQVYIFNKININNDNNINHIKKNLFKYIYIYI